MNSRFLIGTSIVLLAVFSFIFPLSAFAVVTTTGDVDPIPPTNGGSIGGTLRIGEGNTAGDILYGSMTVNGGTVLENKNGIIGDRIGAIGVVHVDGTGSEWNLTDELTVGKDGMAELHLAAMARIHVDEDMVVGHEEGGHGTTTIDGLATILEVADDFTVGFDGFGDFQINNRARLITGDAWIGRSSGANGFVTLQDPGSMWFNTRDVVISETGNATFRILDGALLQNRSATIGQSEGSVGRTIVDGLQSLWNGTTLLTIGDAGYGELYVSDQARVEFSDILVGNASTGNGYVIVEGEGSVWHARNSLVVGSVGLGTIDISNQGLASVVDTTTVGSSGRIQFDGGYLASASVVNNGVILGTGQVIGSIVNDVSGEVRAGQSEYLQISGAVSNAGRLESIGGEMVFDDLVTNLETGGQIAARNAIFRFRGGLENDGTLAASFGTSDIFGDINNNATGAILVAGDSGVTFYDEVTNDGTIIVLPGATSVFVDDLTFTSEGSLIAEIAGYNEENEYPQIEVGGKAALAGLLEVHFDSTSPLADGDTFELIVADDGIMGVFDTTDLPLLANGLSWELDYSTHDVTLRVLAAPFLQSDFDGDGDVDGDDLQSWQASFGADTTGDADGDGDTDGNDFLIWQSEFGSISSSKIVAVPEPACIGLILVAAASLIVITRRRGK